MQRAAPVLLVLALLASAGCGGGALSKKQLQTQIQSVQSFAAEGSLLADQAARGRSTEPFVRVHTEYMQKALKKVETELQRPVAGGQSNETRLRALKLLAQVSAELGRLHRAPGEPELADRVHSALANLADLAEKLAK